MAIVPQNSWITDHSNKYNNNEKVCNIVRIVKHDTVTWSEQKCWENDTDGLAGSRVATDLQFVKNTICEA